ncbi:MAG TPA: NADPH:quinone oxidoreductase family protein [Lentzea sp.]
MRAVIVDVLGSPAGGRVGETDDPIAGEGQVLVEIHAAPVNYVDLVTLSGKYQFTPSLPYTPGKGPAGIVRAVGAGTEGLAIGDRVLAMAEYGGYAELVTIDHRQVYRLPDTMSFVDAAAMSLAFDTAWMALRERARVRPGETVLVLGAGGAVGGAAVQLAKAMGARVLAGVLPGNPVSGADGVIDLSAPDLRNSLREQVYAANDGAGVDVVIDPLGGDPFDAAIRAVGWRGRVVVVGFAAGRIPTLKVNYLMLKNIEVSGLQISDYRGRTPELIAQCYRELFGFYADGLVTAPRSTTMPLEDWRIALKMIEERTAQDRLVLLPHTSEEQHG